MMTATELVPYFHPTQIVLVDDDIDFLGNLTLQLEADLAYLLFDSTAKALTYVNDGQPQDGTRQRFFRIAGSEPRSISVAEANAPARVTLDTDAIRREMLFTNRFSRISVVMVDYAMPQMNGLEFCERIDNPYIKKILFTGVATEADAVDAFNRGVIDRYIRKSEHQVYEHLNRTIRELQHAHIRDTFAAAGEVFEVESPSFLEDPAVASLMATLAAGHGFVEHYLCANPPGFILIDGDGRMRRLVLYDGAERARQMNAARRAGAPAACLEALAEGRVVFDPAAGEDRFERWARDTSAAERLEGRELYAWSLFHHVPELDASGGPTATYNRYLEWLDTVGYALM